MLSIKLPLNTTRATPRNAVNEPNIKDDLSFSFLYRIHDNRAVKIGEVQIISDTFDANVIPKAVFSNIKYNAPPHNPDAANKSSSFVVFANNFRGQINHIPIYANRKRYKKISTGESP